mmetsp:Transcript_9205/g.16177  ORF Transcript_9205/g.16177 Transcript_9205/m.16177 type:complete len:104 (-) Transcript_9205:406-717(-)|eukprot:CAMPEP_0119101810 /NCGR_PEP_ID=MMETSP1180-20130426/756_1 /TAXON_ID=3052 ORGANISM="Chlamydomonas cf sp, Strain CCMP681" /NCGR_SAMPLE_ID=MMETSP1180 /ASSEMBLY_ACC=CAM_ASM_000741 /LENGTH=103 /DNA_ID=CAMNT_0007085985 /DNA_START=45 /DNA_END=356 /DNA_ORIENTATION=-
MLANRSSLATRPAPAKASRRATLKPSAAVSPKLAASVAAAVAVAVTVVAPAEAANVVSSIASASEGWPFVPPSWAPSVLVPLVGLVVPAVGMAWAFTYIEKDA